MASSSRAERRLMSLPFRLLVPACVLLGRAVCQDTMRVRQRYSTPDISNRYIRCSPWVESPQGGHPQPEEAGEVLCQSNPLLPVLAGPGCCRGDLGGESVRGRYVEHNTVRGPRCSLGGDRRGTPGQGYARVRRGQAWRGLAGHGPWYGHGRTARGSLARPDPSTPAQKIGPRGRWSGPAYRNTPELVATCRCWWPRESDLAELGEPSAAGYGAVVPSRP